MSRSRHSLLVCLAAFSLLGAACSDDDGNSAEDDSPSAVAVAYTQAVADGDWDAARAYVAQEARDTFDRVSDAAIDADTEGHDLAAGDEKVDGDEATVVILGELCSTPPDEDEQCVDNDDPASDNPIFIVHLIDDQGWAVTFPSPLD